MIGLIPCSLALDQNSKAPNTLPWSVMAIASMPSSAVRAKRSSSRAAPSSMEYSVCTCRCTNPSRDPPAMDARGSSRGHSSAYVGRAADGLAMGKTASLSDLGHNAGMPRRQFCERALIVLGLEHRAPLASGVHGCHELGVVVGIRGLDHRDHMLVEDARTARRHLLQRHLRRALDVVVGHPPHARAGQRGGV